MDTVRRPFARHRSTLLLTAVATLAAAGLIAAMTSGTARAGTVGLGTAAATDPPVEATGPPTPDVEATPSSTATPPTLDACPAVADRTPSPVGDVVAPARYRLARASTSYVYTVDLAGLVGVNLIDSDGKWVIRCTAPARTKLEVSTGKQPKADAIWFEFSPAINGANCDVKIDAFDDKGMYKGTHELNVPGSGLTIEENKIRLVGPKGTRLKITVTCN